MSSRSESGGRRFRAQHRRKDHKRARRAMGEGGRLVPGVEVAARRGRPLVGPGLGPAVVEGEARRGRLPAEEGVGEE